MHKQERNCYLTTLFIFSIIFGVIGLSTFFSGYYRGEKINSSFIVTPALIKEHYSTGCSQSTCCGYSGNDCIQWCNSCVNHYLVFEYTPDPSIVEITNLTTSNIYMYSDKYSIWNDVNYKVGNIIAVYMNVCPYIPIEQSAKDNCLSHNVRDTIWLYLLPTTTNFVTGIVFFSLTGLCIIISLILIWNTMPKSIKIPKNVNNTRSHISYNTINSGGSSNNIGSGNNTSGNNNNDNGGGSSSNNNNIDRYTTIQDEPPSYQQVQEIQETK